MSIETEIKLLVDGKSLGRLATLDLVQRAIAGQPKRRHLVATYFDTPDGHLRKAGLTLRLRREGKRLVQTVKSEAGEGDDPLSRGEWEAEVRDETPDLAAAEDSPVPALLADAGLGAEALEPQVTVTTNRQIFPLALDGAEVEMAIDRGRIAAGGRTVPVTEVELELKSGEAVHMLRFVRALLAEVPARLEHRSKSARGFALIDGDPAPEKARGVDLDGEMSIEQAFKRVVASCFAQMTANEGPALAGRDPEGVHQLRVGIRRLRSAFSLFGKVLPHDMVMRLKPQLRAAMAAFGPAREWDVLLTETLEPLLRRIPDDPGIKRLRRIAEAARADGHRHLREMLASPAYAELKLSLLELLADNWSGYADEQPLKPWIDPTRAGPPWAAPIEVFADRILRKRHKQLRRIGKGHATMTVEELHELRIAAKKLRYAADFFRSLYPKRRVRRYIAALAAVQDCLGAINDGAVGRARVAEAWEKLGGLSRRSTQRARAEGAVEGWFAAVEHVEFVSFAAAWRRFLDVERFWRKPRPLTDY